MEDRCLGSHISLSPSMEDIRTKLLRIVRCHEESKTAFQQLKSQIKISLLEAEDVFASLSIPLMRLVGLKTEEMAEEGRSTRVLINPDFQSAPENSRSLQQHRRGSKAGHESATRIHRDRDRQHRKSEEDSYSSQAEKARRELEEKQRLRLHQLVFILRQIEKLVNSRQAAILQSLDDHRLSLRRLFQKATSYLFNIRQRDQPIDPMLIAAFRLLRATFEHVGLTLGSVEDDVEAMVQELAEKMCEPMAGHVKSLRADMERGPAGQLVGVVEEMEWAVREKVAEAEVARKRAKASEEEKAEVVRRLKDFEENVRSTKEFIGLFMEAKRRGMEPSTVAHKLLAMEKDQRADDKLLWNILNQKRQRQQEASPVGPTLLYSPQNSTLANVNRVESYRKNNLHGDEILTMDRPSRKNDTQTPRPVIISPRPITRSYSRKFVRETQRAGPSLPQLGPSPSSIVPNSSRSHKHGPPSTRSTKGKLYS
ncbi:uncharacterized protein LOC131239289 [Magnolia sinica]|uniref:uncharacterized protein LOC131239289 n=1 Tax=Magnolia sinica TaxID=86752 RepID=UPI002658F8EE|nr:uncharacterized protein LOC131239289 [Magnolia sinica]